MERLHRASRAHAWGALGVAAVLVTAGYLFAANAHLQGGADARQPQDLLQLVQAELDHSARSAEEVSALRAEVDALTDAQTEVAPQVDPEVALIEIAAGRVPVSGPGVTVRLTDAAANAPRPDWVTNDDLVVHQQDLQAVINALWTGGAEAMTLQGERVVSTSAFRCVGNVLLLHGQHYSPPYVVQAIGDPDDLREALLDSTAVQTYLDYVDAVGLGWSVDTEESLQLAAYEASVDLQFARVPDGVEVPGVVAEP